MSKHPMVRYIHHLLQTHGHESVDDVHGPHRALALQVEIRGQLQPKQGAVRVHLEFPELFEMLSVLQVGPGGQEVMGTFVFAGEDVQTVLFVPQAGQLVEDRSGDGTKRTASGLVIG